jgi:Uma2 family endonuclease
LTIAEYLAIEESASYKSEYIAGEMYAMAGGSPRHALLAANVIRELGNALKGGSCAVYSSDLRVAVLDAEFFSYPDATVVCGPLQFSDAGQMAVINPSAIVEVLSDSTEAYDRGAKFRLFSELPSLQTYILVSQRTALIEVFTRDTGIGWRLDPVSAPAEFATFPALAIKLALAEIYAGVDFPALPPNREIPAA